MPTRRLFKRVRHLPWTRAAAKTADAAAKITNISPIREMLHLLLYSAVGLGAVLVAARLFFRLTSGAFDIDQYDLAGKTYVITGATSGGWRRVG